MMRTGGAAAIALAGALVLSSCAANEAPAGDETGGLSGTLNGAGASSQGSAMEAWIAAFQTEHPDVTVNYDPSGSGAGRETFIAGGSAWAGSDSALSEEELAGTFGACAEGAAAIDLPTYISPIAVIFNVDGVDELRLDATTLAGIFRGDITRWDDPRIAGLNAGTTFPDAPITAVHRSDDSGTTKNFADYLHTVAPEVWDAEPSDTFPYPTGEGAQGTSGVVDAVTNGSNTIGYADASKAGSLGTVKIQVGGEFVGYSPEAAAAVVEGSPPAEGRAENDIAIRLDRSTEDPSHYPLVLVSYSIVCTEYADPEQGALAKAFISFITSEAGQRVAADAAGAAPLSPELSARVADALSTIV